MSKPVFLVILAVLWPAIVGGTMSSTSDSVGAELAAGLMEVWNSNDAPTIESLFTPDCVYEDTNGHIYEGREGAVRYVGHIHAWADSVRVETKSIVALGDAAVVEWQFSGRQVIPVGFIDFATGKEFSIRGVTVIESNGEQITRASDYVDIATFLTQLGVQCSAIAEE